MARMRRFGKWVLSAIGLGSDAQFSYQVLWPWFVTTAMPVISTSIVISVSVVNGAPWWAYPFGVPAALAVAVVLFSGLLRIVPTFPFAKRETATPSVPPAPLGAANIGQQVTTVGSVVSHDQSGGVTAGVVTNIGQQPRTLRGTSASTIIGELQQLKGLTIGFDSLAGSGEADAFTDEIQAELRVLGCATDVHRTDTMHFPPRRGVYVIYYQDNDEIRGQAWSLARAITKLGVLCVAVLDTKYLRGTSIGGGSARPMDLCVSVGSPASSLEEFSDTDTRGREWMMAKKNDDERPSIHVESHNQQGGITAYTVNVYGPLPARATLSRIEHEAISEGHRYRATLSLETRYVLPVLLIVARGRTVTAIHASPVGGGGMMSVREGYLNDGSGHFTQFANASGQYVVEVLTREPEPVVIDVGQEAITS